MHPQTETNRYNREREKENAGRVKAVLGFVPIRKRITLNNIYAINRKNAQITFVKKINSKGGRGKGKGKGMKRMI